MASITKYEGFLPAQGETSLYLTNHVEDFFKYYVSILRGAWGVQANAYFAYLGGGWGVLNQGKHSLVNLHLSDFLDMGLMET